MDCFSVVKLLSFSIWENSGKNPVQDDLHAFYDQVQLCLDRHLHHLVWSAIWFKSLIVPDFLVSWSSSIIIQKITSLHSLRITLFSVVRIAGNRCVTLCPSKIRHVTCGALQPFKLSIANSCLNHRSLLRSIAFLYPGAQLLEYFSFFHTWVLHKRST